LKTETLKEILAAMARAKAKHGAMVSSRPVQICILTEELGEASQAFLDGLDAGYRMEIMDLIAAAIRVYEKESYNG
jgi:hypothetical protein